MNVEIPKIAENVDTAEVVRILVEVGDHVTADQPILELEGDKASFELPSPAEGEIAEICVEEGDEVKVGEVVMTLHTPSDQPDDEDDEDEKDEEAESDDDEEEPESDDEGEAESDDDEDEDDERDPGEAKAAPRHEKKASRSQPRRRRAEPDGEKAKRANGGKREKAASRGNGSSRVPRAVVRASPAARRRARELGVDLGAIAEEVRGARITPDDIERRAKTKSKAARGASNGEDFSRFGEVTEEKLPRRRRVLAARMAEAWRTIPHVTQHDDLDVTQLEAARRRRNERHAGEAEKLTMTPLVVKACALALSAHPRLNASLAGDGTKLLLKRYVNVAVAVDTESGLVAPVVHGAHEKSLATIAREIDELAASVRAGRITHEELAGGTFTVTNLGGFGGTYFTPIIYPPQVAILGLSRTQLRDGQSLLPVSLSYDHRVIDGAGAMRFLTTLADLLRDPLAMLMQA
jgi:pyruvate dehydrogenase E2 component (dihydrolipoamide acetyltransferase)